MNRHTNKRNRRFNRHTRHHGGEIEHTINKIKKFIEKKGSSTILYLVQNDMEPTASEIECEALILNKLRDIHGIKHVAICFIAQLNQPRPPKFTAAFKQLKITSISRVKDLQLDRLLGQIRAEVHEDVAKLMLIPTTMSEIQDMAPFISKTMKMGLKSLIIPCTSTNISVEEAASFKSAMAAANAEISASASASVAASAASAASSNKLDPARPCNVCGKTPKSVGREHHKRCHACNRNKASRYCSTECQRTHWKMGHKLVHPNNSNRKSNE